MPWIITRVITRPVSQKHSDATAKSQAVTATAGNSSTPARIVLHSTYILPTMLLISSTSCRCMHARAQVSECVKSLTPSQATLQFCTWCPTLPKSCCWRAAMEITPPQIIYTATPTKPPNFHTTVSRCGPSFDHTISPRADHHEFKHAIPGGLGRCTCCTGHQTKQGHHGFELRLSRARDGI